jgi:hypothetical protein
MYEEGTYFRNFFNKRAQEQIEAMERVRAFGMEGSGRYWADRFRYD